MLKPRWSEALLLGVCAALCARQTLIPPYIGLANNGDFAKVYQRFGCAPPDGGARNYRYLVADYEFNPKYRWVSDLQSSENLLAAVPILLVKASGARVFNIRWLGFFHMLLFLCAYYALLLYLRRFGRGLQLAAGSVVLFIFTDVAYVSYFNSFFNDTAAMLGLLLMVPLALHLTAQQPPRAWTVWLFTLAAVLFVTSKTQHCLWAVFPAALLVWRRRFLPAVLPVAAAAYMLLTTSPSYSAISLYSVTFYKLAPHAPEPEAALRELGLGKPEYRYIGTHPYMPGSPSSPVWMADFYHRVGFGKVMRYWLRHPGEALDALRGDLAYHHDLRTPLGNYRREDGYPPEARTNRFAAWSDLRNALYERWPGHIVVWYVFIVAAAIVALRRPSARGPALVCLGVSILAILEFCVVALADAIETERHLFMFHVLTELSICFAAGWVLHAVIEAWRVRVKPPPSLDRQRHLRLVTH